MGLGLLAFTALLKLTPPQATVAVDAPPPDRTPVVDTNPVVHFANPDDAIEVLHIDFLLKSQGKAFSFLGFVITVIYQLLVENGLTTTGASVCVDGILVTSQGSKQKVELKVEKLITVGKSDPSFPIQKKRVSKEFLRTKSHLRPRTNTFGAVSE